MGKLITGHKLVKKGSTGKATRFTAPEFSIRSTHMARTTDNKSVMFYDAEIVGPDDLNIVSIISDTEIQVNASSTMINEVSISWDDTVLEIPLSSYNYVMVDSNGDLILSDYYVENNAIIAIVATTEAAISTLYPFVNAGRYLVYKVQSIVDGVPQWTDSDVTHIIGSGERCNFTYDEDTDVASLVFIKNDQLYRRDIEINGSIAQFEYKSDYNVLDSIVQPDHINKTLFTKPSAILNTTVNRFNPFLLTGIIEGIRTDNSGNTNKYSFTLPYISIDNTYTLRYRSVEAIVLYDKDMNEINRYSPSQNGNLVDIDIEGGTVYVGLIAEYSLFNSHIMVQDITFTSSEVYPIVPYDKSDDIKVITDYSVSGTFGFEITETYVYDRTMQLDGMSSTGASTMDMSIGPRYNFETIIGCAEGSPSEDEGKVSMTSGSTMSFSFVES